MENILTPLCRAADPEGVCYKALGFSRGFAPDAQVSAYLKLLPMLAGIGSPGTIQEVLMLSSVLATQSHPDQGDISQASSSFCCCHCCPMTPAHMWLHVTVVTD